MASFISSGGGTGAPAIDTVKVNQFKAGFMEAFQQKDVRLAGSVMQASQDSEFAFWDRIGIAEDMTEDTVRYGDNPQSEISFDRRRTQLKDYELGKYIDPKDLNRVLTDPKGPVQTQMRYSGYRKIDDIIRDNVFADAVSGKNGGTTISFASQGVAGAGADNKLNIGALSAGNSNPITTAGIYNLEAGDVEGIDVGVEFDGTGTGSTATGITLEKLKAIRYTMMRMDVIEQSEVLDIWLGSAQFSQLLDIDEIINADYSIRKNLAEGNVTTYLGFRFRHFERLNGSGTAADPRQCIVMKKEGFLYTEGTSLGLDVWNDTGKKNIPYMYMKLQADGTRMLGDCVARVNCID